MKKAREKKKRGELMVSPSEKLVSVRDAICRLLVLVVFCTLVSHWVCRVRQDESLGGNESQGGEEACFSAYQPG